MNDTTTAVTRTSVFAAWLFAIVAYIATSIDMPISEELAPLLAPVFAMIAGGIYAVVGKLAERWPIIGLIAFGSTSTPTYNKEA